MGDDASSGLQASGQAANESFDETPVGAEPVPCPPSGTAPRTAISWISIALVGEDDEPVVGERYKVTLADGTTIEGRLGSTGVVRIEGIDPGRCTVSFPELDEDAWEPARGG